jgi:hypothetical protein
MEAFATESLEIVDDAPVSGVPASGASVRELTYTEVRNLPEVSALLRASSALRRTASTNVHEASSRSHTVFTLTIVRTPPPGSTDLPMVGKINLVDLAGSESVKRSGSENERLVEAKSINSSLAALGNVVAALGSDTPAGHVPFRDSKLTRILKVCILT